MGWSWDCGWRALLLLVSCEVFRFIVPITFSTPGAKDSLTYAQVDCQYVPSQINLSDLELAAKLCASGGVCDGLGNLTTTRVYFFSGTKDTVVNPGVVKAAYQFYVDLGTPSSNLKGVFSYAAEHAFPTDDYGPACSHLGTPYINNCAYDSAFDMLDFLFGGGLKPPVSAPASNIFTLSQQDYTPNHVAPSSLSLGPNAYVYVPSACSNNQSDCKLVVNLHGCQQTLDDVQLQYITKTGMNEVAEANNIVVLYPQTIKSSLSPFNPQGCFD